MRPNYVYTCGIVLTFSPLFCYGQALKIGQKIPDVTMHHVINYKTDSIRLSDERGKLVILDFWGTGCSSCVASFPTMDKLQKQFGNKIRIIMVNKESEDSTKRFFARRPWIILPQLPFATQDSILETYFPHFMVPEHVWIDKDDTICAVTVEGNASSKNILTALDGKPLNLFVKKDVHRIIHARPVLSQGSEPFLKNMQFSSSLLSPPVGDGGGYSSDRKRNSPYPYHIRVKGSAKHLFVKAFEENGRYDFWGAKNSVILEVKDTFKFKEPTPGTDGFNNWARHYWYGYDLWVPPSQAYRIYSIMKLDLEKYFAAYGTIEKRLEECVVLTKGFKDGLLSTKGGRSFISFREAPHDSLCYWHNWPFKEFVGSLRLYISNQALSTPFVDATDFKENVDIALPASLIDERFNMTLLRNWLRRYGLYLKKEKRMVDVLVIKDLDSRDD